MTTEEIFTHANKGSVWCIMNREPFETWITRCDTSFNPFDRKLMCDSVDIRYHNIDMPRRPSDIYLTKEDAEAALQERKELPSVYDISQAYSRIHIAINTLDFYTDDAMRGVVDKLMQAYVELYEIEKRIRDQE